MKFYKDSCLIATVINNGKQSFLATFIIIWIVKLRGGFAFPVSSVYEFALLFVKIREEIIQPNHFLPGVKRQKQCWELYQQSLSLFGNYFAIN